MYRQIRSEYSGRVAMVTLDRPQRRNAFSAELMREMIACARELEARDDVDAVIVAGAAGCFSAGADLKDASRWAGGAPLLAQREIAGLGQRMARAWEELPQVTIAAIEGYAVGGGLALAVALDWRVMARDAFVSLPEISLGIPLTWGTLPRLFCRCRGEFWSVNFMSIPCSVCIPRREGICAGSRETKFRPRIRQGLSVRVRGSASGRTR